MASTKTFTALMLSLAVASTPALAGGVIQPATPPAVIVEDTSRNAEHLIVPVLTLLIILAAIAHGESTAAPSDTRFKTDITPVGTAENGLTLYSYRYIWDDAPQIGVMAQEVLSHTPEAVITLPGNFYAVDYEMLGLR